MAENTASSNSGEWKRMLSERYEDIEWIDDVEEYRCSRCNRVETQLFIANCKHLFCYNCRNTETCPKLKCPKCHQFITQAVANLDKQIGELHVYCPNKKYGCKHQNQLNKIADHLRECLDSRGTSLPDTNDKTNTTEFMRNFAAEMNDKLQQLIQQMTIMNNKCEEVHEKYKELEAKVDSKLHEIVQQMNSQFEQVHVTTFEAINNICESNRKQMSGTAQEMISNVQQQIRDVDVKWTTMLTEYHEAD